MKVKSIRICNFKSFNDCTIHFNDFNVLIGANASGKSNFVEIFRLIKNIEQYGLENAISLAGGIEYFRNSQIGANEDFLLEIVFCHDNYFLPLTRKLDNIILYIKECVYRLGLEFSSSDDYKIKEDKIIHKFDIRKEQKKDDFKSLGSGELVIYQSLENAEKISFDFIIPPELNSLIKENDLSNYLEFKRHQEFQRLYIYKNKLQIQTDICLLETSLFWLYFPGFYIQKLNDIGIFDFDPKLPKKASPITGKADLEEDGSNLAIVLNKIIRNPENNRKLANLITDLLPFIDKLEIEKFADKSLMFKLKETYAKNNQYIPAAFMSDGTINIIALVVALYFEKEILTIIEEPERNIHPSLIGKIVQFMQDASQNKQIIVTTHNPEIVKHCNLEDLLLITRDEDGFSQISRPSDSEQVKIFLENEIGIEDLYIQNLLEIGQ